jgi:hypothetical protein
MEANQPVKVISDRSSGQLRRYRRALCDLSCFLEALESTEKSGKKNCFTQVCFLEAQPHPALKRQIPLQVVLWTGPK